MITMLPEPKSNPNRPTRSPRAVIAILMGSLLLAACSQPSVHNESLPQQIAASLAENACINRCQATKDGCDDDARFEYAQCQAGYGQGVRGYRRCLASSAQKCGYPWWSCSENNYGYCTNRYWECRDACRQTHRLAGGNTG